MRPSESAYGTTDRPADRDESSLIRTTPHRRFCRDRRVSARRHDDIAAYFAANATALERTVARHVVAGQAVVEDARSVAWSKLLRRPDIHLGNDGFWWLHRVAVREVWRITQDARRQRSLNGDAELDRLPVGDDVATVAERRHTLRALDELPERQARSLVLHGCGFTYAEIARMTGASYRTVDRQLRRARERLRDADHQSLAARETQVLDRLAAHLTVHARRPPMLPATAGLRV